MFEYSKRPTCLPNHFDGGVDLGHNDIVPLELGGGDNKLRHMCMTQLFVFFFINATKGLIKLWFRLMFFFCCMT